MRIGPGSLGCVVAGVSLLACTDLPLAPADQDRLDLAERRWAARGFVNYSVISGRQPT